MAKLVCTETFHAATKKGLVSVVEGKTYDEKEPWVKANPDKFVPVDEWVEGQSRVFSYVEAATAAPGESRNVKKPAAKKKTASKK